MATGFDDRLRLEPESASPARARRFVEDVLVRSGHEAVLETALLLTSELVTNAVLHGQGSDIGVTVRVDGGVRVEVHDNGPGIPSPKHYADDAGTGRGLLLVEAMSTAWGVEVIGHGKTVWFEVDAPGDMVIPDVDLDDWPDLDDVAVPRTPPGLDLVPIELRGVPLELQRRTREHYDELWREFALVRSREPDNRDTVPARLLDLIEELARQYNSFTAATSEEMTAALERGETSIDVHYELPRTVGPACEHFDALLDEADDYCRAGELLTLATPPDIAAYRRWFLCEFIVQAAGGPVTPWPQYGR